MVESRSSFFQYINKGRFWHFHITNQSHFLLPLCLSFQQFHLSGDVSSILQDRKLIKCPRFRKQGLVGRFLCEALAIEFQPYNGGQLTYLGVSGQAYAITGSLMRLY